MAHSPEPWTVCNVTKSIEDDEGHVVVLGFKDVDMMLQSDEQADPEDLQRIVACVNYCKGLDTEQLIISTSYQGREQ